MNVELLYYTDNRLDVSSDKRLPRLADTVRSQLLSVGLPIISVSLKPLSFGRNIHFKGRRSHSTMFRQIITGLQESRAEYIFMTEHDVLYHPSHFEFVPPRDDTYYYNNNVWKWRLSDNKVVGYDCCWCSQLCASRELLLSHYEKKLDIIDSEGKAYGYEPGTGQSRKIDGHGSENWESEYPNIDIRHGKNWTGVSRMDPDEFRNKKNCQNWQEVSLEDIPGWDINFLKSI